MSELSDYSGEFRPDLKMEDFSKEALVRLWKAGGKMYVGLDGLWYNAIQDAYGDDVARKMSESIWLERGGSEMEVRRVREAGNITEDDVASYLKMLQIDPGFAAVMDIQCELLDEKRGVVTVKKCRVLQALERMGDPSRIEHLCHIIEPHGFQVGVEQFNPQMKATPLQLPPRKDKNDIACKWEFRIDE